MPKLTETTNDKLRAASDGGVPHVIAAHEPIPGEQFITPPPLQFPTIPLPPKPKKGRKAKEQKANLAPVQPAKPPLRIALVGTAPSSRMLAPYRDPTWTIWGCSPGNMNTIPRVDAWFEIHGVALNDPEDAHYAPQYIQWMNNLPVPLYMQDQQLCPKAITIPKDDLIAEFGPYFFTSSFSWMMAMAIKAIEANGIVPGVSEIRLFGIDMASREEYIIQRPGAYHFFQEAARRGIKISAPNESDIMQPPPLYGYSDVSPFGTKLRARKKEIAGRLGPMRQQRADIDRNITYLEGALEDLDYIACINGGVQDNSNSTYLESLVKQAKPTHEPARVSVTTNSQG